MKQTNMLLRGFAVCAVAMSLAIPAFAEQAKERTAKIVRTKGPVRYKMDSNSNNGWQPLKVGTEIKPGMVIQTAKGAYADIVVGAANISSAAQSASPPSLFMDYQPSTQSDVVRLLEDSVLSFEKLSASQTQAGEVTDTQCDLRSGRLFFSIKKMTAASRFEIKIPNGVAGIRGTIGMVSADGVMAILSGSGVMAYSKSDGTLVTQVVPGGYVFDAPSNQLTRMSSSINGELSRMSQETHLPGPPPPRPPRPIHHTSPHDSDDQGEDNNNQGGNGGGNNQK